MNKKDFGESYLKDIFYRIEGFNELEEERQQQNWERTRWQVAWLFKQPEKGRKLRKLTDFVKFYWEKTTKATPLTKDDEKNFAKMEHKLKKIDKKGNWKTM